MRRIVYLIIVALFMLSGCAPGADETMILPVRQDTQDDAQADTQGGWEEHTADVAVYICGEVTAPGLYFLEEGARIADALAAAGGPTEIADLQRINLAQRVTDGQQIIVYAENAGEDNHTPGTEGSGTGRVNLNYAGKEELMTLPGIGESRADAILAYREENGWFCSTEELMNISGIKEKMFEKIADLIEV